MSHFLGLVCASTMVDPSLAYHCQFSALLALKQNEDVRRVTSFTGTERAAAIHTRQNSVTLSHLREVFPHAPSLLALLSISTKMPSVVEQRRLLVQAEEFQAVAWRG